MNIIASFFLCHTADCCPSVNLTDSNTVLIGGTKTNADGTILLPIAEYENAISAISAENTASTQTTANIVGENIQISGRPLTQPETKYLAKPLDENEAGIEISLAEFLAIQTLLSAQAA